MLLRKYLQTKTLPQSTNYPPAEYELPSRRVRTTLPQSTKPGKTLPQSTKPGKTLPQSTKKKNGIGMEFRFLGVSCLRSGGI